MAARGEVGAGTPGTLVQPGWGRQKGCEQDGARLNPSCTPQPLTASPSLQIEKQPSTLGCYENELGFYLYSAQHSAQSTSGIHNMSENSSSPSFSKRVLNWPLRRPGFTNLQGTFL